MAEITVIKLPNGSLAPADDESSDYLRRRKIGQAFRVRISTMRNVRFHRKFFALMKYAFDAWNPPAREYNGHAIEKNFDTFRKEMIIAAGYYDASYGYDGRVVLSARSISFSEMDEEEFDILYSAVIDVMLRTLFNGSERSDIDSVVNRILEFS